MTWTVEEMRKDGSWVRCAQAHAWETNADAHKQRVELTARYPKRVYAVCKMTEADASGDEKQ